MNYSWNEEDIYIPVFNYNSLLSVCFFAIDISIAIVYSLHFDGLQQFLKANS